jgi:hypothetical protein
MCLRILLGNHQRVKGLHNQVVKIVVPYRQPTVDRQRRYEAIGVWLYTTFIVIKAGPLLWSKLVINRKLAVET